MRLTAEGTRSFPDYRIRPRPDAHPSEARCSDRLDLFMHRDCGQPIGARGFMSSALLTDTGLVS